MRILPAQSSICKQFSAHERPTQSQKQAAVRRPVVIAPAVVDSCASDAPPKPDPGFVVMVPQAPRTWLPGCAGNVVPGAPASADADVADAAKSVRLAIPIAIARRIAHLHVPIHVRVKRRSGW